MTMMATLVTIIGISLLYVGTITSGKGRQSVVSIIGGIIYLYMGLFVIVDPPLTLSTVSTLFGIIGGTAVLGKFTLWAISKTDLYQNMNNALLAVPAMQKDIMDFKDKWEKEHSIKD